MRCLAPPIVRSTDAYGVLQRVHRLTRLKGIGLATRKPPTDCYRRVLGRGLRQLAQAHARFGLIRRHNNQRADLSFVVISDMDLSWPVNHMGEMGRVTTRHPPDRNKELMVMRVVGDTCQGHPGGFFLIAESATDDVKLRFVAFVRLAKASKKSTQSVWGIWPSMVSRLLSPKRSWRSSAV